MIKNRHWQVAQLETELEDLEMNLRVEDEIVAVPAKRNSLQDLAAIGAEPAVPVAEIHIAERLSDVGFPGRFFDKVVIWHVLGHLANPRETHRRDGATLCPRGLGQGGRSTLLNLENNGIGHIRLSDTSADGSVWTFQAEGPSFRFNKGGTGGAEDIVRSRNDASGNATLSVDGSVAADNVTFMSSRLANTG